MVQKKRKKTASKKKPSTSFFETIGDIFKPDAKTIGKVIDSSNFKDLIDPDHDLTETYQTGAQDSSDIFETNKTSRKKTPTPTVSQEEIQRTLVLALADNSRFSLADLLIYWQKYVDAMVDWDALIHRKDQAQIATDLVRKATQKRKLLELKKAIDEIL